MGVVWGFEGAMGESASGAPGRHQSAGGGGMRLCSILDEAPL